MIEIDRCPLGKKTKYDSHYNRSLLFSIPRKEKREGIGIFGNLPFRGADLWTGYELSWLDSKGKPCIGILQIIVPCDTSNIFESKSLKLYLISLNQTKFENHAEVQSVIQKDLSDAINGQVNVQIFKPEQFSCFKVVDFSGICIDDLDIAVDQYTVEPKYLQAQGPFVEETLYSHLFKANCLITHQPDWGSVHIRYVGPRMNHERLLKYLISYRQHNEFHEQCAERIYMDILRQCQPEKLTIYIRFLRKGGIDINPFRSNFESFPENQRTNRQ